MSGTSEGARKAAQNRSAESFRNAGIAGSKARTHQSRVEAGKKAARTRGHESLAEAGRKGGVHSHDRDRNRSLNRE